MVVLWTKIVIPLQREIIVLTVTLEVKRIACQLRKLLYLGAHCSFDIVSLFTSHNRWLIREQSIFMGIRDREICNGTACYFDPSFERGHRLFWSISLRGHLLFQCSFSTGPEIIFKYSDTGPWIIFNGVSYTGPIIIFPSFPKFYTGPRIIFLIFQRDQWFSYHFWKKFPDF